LTSWTIGDKTFTMINETLLATATLEFVQFGSTYVLNINDIDTSGPANFSLSYTILAEDPNAIITSISVDPTCSRFRRR